MSKNALLISVQMLKDRTGIHDNVDEKLVFPVIKTCQDMFIHPILGTALYNKIVGDINASGTTTGDYKNLLDDYIVDALCYYTLSKLPIQISFQFWNKGVVRKVGDNTELPDVGTLDDVANEYKSCAEFYGERLTKYLRTYSTNSFLPEYLSPGNNIDTIMPEQTAFSMPIFLGGRIDESLDRNNCHGCRENQIDLNL